MGDDYNNLSEVGRASEYIAKAFQLRDHAGEWEKLEYRGRLTIRVTGSNWDKAAQTIPGAGRQLPAGMG